VLNRTGQQGNVYQAHQQGKWNPRSSAYGRFWIDVPSGERKRRTVSLGLCVHTSSEQVSVPPDPSSRYYISAAGRMVDGVSLYA
jgi:hypothetical protein